MMRTLYSRLALTLFILLGVIGVVLAVLIARASTLYQQEVAQTLNHSLAEHIAGEYRLLDGRRPNRAALDELFHQLMVINPAIELYLLDAEGRILAYSAPPDVVQRDRVALTPILAFLRGDQPAPLRGDDPRSSEGRKIFSAAAVNREGERQGYLYIVLGGDQYDRVADMVGSSYIIDAALVVLALALLAALAGGLTAFAHLTRRLRRLSRVMQDYAATEHSDAPRPRYLTPSTSDDEIDALGRQFNDMAATIERHQLEQRRAEDQRREMLANVSHDLRTPLTSLRGYLETLLLKWSQLDQGEQRRYLETALSHSHRLGQRVKTLFELARLEARETVCQEPFSMAELVQDVCQGYMLKAETRNVCLVVRANDANTLVFGDIGMMQRVLDNLLENALRHTPKGGRMEVHAGVIDSAVQVDVSNTGPTLDAAEAERIFERFYQSDTSRHNGGAGLGLAIVKRILELHGSCIRVRQDPVRGTCFYFTLAGSDSIKKTAEAETSAG